MPWWLCERFFIHFSLLSHVLLEFQVSVVQAVAVKVRARTKAFHYIELILFFKILTLSCRIYYTWKLCGNKTFHSKETVIPVLYLIILNASHRYKSMLRCTNSISFSTSWSQIFLTDELPNSSPLFSPKYKQTKNTCIECTVSISSKILSLKRRTAPKAF